MKLEAENNLKNYISILEKRLGELEDLVNGDITYRLEIDGEEIAYNSSDIKAIIEVIGKEKFEKVRERLEEKYLKRIRRRIRREK